MSRQILNLEPMTVPEDVRDFLTRNSVEDESVLVAVSGGIDSIVLLVVLSELESDFNLELSVAHLDHGLRGESSAEDAEFVRSRARELGYEARVDRRPVKPLAEEENLSLEEAARSVRYDFLRETAEKRGQRLIALGHNKNDQAETILMHLLRGTGLRGLGGMKERSGPYIRPLLRTSRESIEDYARGKGLNYRVDETNTDTDFTRNRIRHRLLPKLKEEFNPRVVEVLVRLGRHAREAQSFIDGEVEAAAEELRVPEEEKGNCFRRDEFLELHPCLQKKTIRKFIEETKGDFQDLTAAHVDEVLRKLNREPARTRLDLPGITFILTREQACFARKPPEGGTENFEYPLGPGECLELEEADLEISLEVGPVSEAPGREDFAAESLTEVVDWRKVERPIRVRNRRSGDRFVPLGMSGEKKLKDFFIDAKVPFDDRDRIPLICDGRGIIWVVGHRIDDRYRLEESTTEVLIMRASEI